MARHPSGWMGRKFGRKPERFNLPNMDYPALLIELKWKHSDLGAIAQIKEKQYAHWVKEYTGDILLVGINYDENKGHECLIEKYVVEKE